MELLGNFNGVEVYVNVVNMFSENTYLIVDPGSGSALVVDPGGDWELIRDFLVMKRLKLVGIFNTHGHLDHVVDNPRLRSTLGGPVAIHRNDAYMLSRIDIPMLRQLVESGLMDFTPHEPDLVFDDDYSLRLGEYDFRVIHTPGHTMGSSVLYCGELGIAFTGDTLFKGAIGRVDLPHSDPRLMVESLRRIGNELEDDVLVLPGHGEYTRLGLERGLMDYFIDELSRGLLG
jgi:glyoxylase-like metal-dependent hydrolase (beta-lactamase superfamily II)